MRQFLITIPDDKEPLFIEMMRDTKFVEKVEAITTAGLPDKQEEIAPARIHHSNDPADCCLSWEEIDQIIES